MGEVSHGADSERLRGAGRDLLRSSEHAEAVADSGRALLRVLEEHWSGDDLDAFSHAWPLSERALLTGSQMLRTMAESAIRNAHEQDRASEGSAGGGRATGPTAGFMGSGPSEKRYEYPGGESSGQAFGYFQSSVAQEWTEDLTPEQRRAVLQEIVEEEAARQGVDPAPEIQFKDLKDGAAGAYNTRTGTLVMDNDLVNTDPRMAIHTAVHETRHAAQSEAIRDVEAGRVDELPEGVSEEEVAEWAANDDNYVNPSPWYDFLWSDERKAEQYEKYWNQPLEEDAREAGRDYLSDVDHEELDRLLEESEA